MAELRQLILNKIPNFSNNTSWRFIDGDFEFANPSNPWATPFPEVFNIVDLTEDQMDMSFVGLKVGDIDGNAIPNQLMAQNRNNSNGELNLVAADKFVKRGEQVTLSLSANEFNAIQGFQFALNFNTSALEFVDVKSATLPNLNESNFGYTLLEEGILMASWNEVTGSAISLGSDEKLFQLVFNAKQDGLLSELINFTPRFMNAEAYAEGTGTLDLNLQFGDNTPVSATFELYQNRPNPFNGLTQIGFNLPEASTINITIYDVAGRTIRQIDGEYAKGYNEITLDKADLDATGILYYRLDTPSHTATRKMVILD